ncbi:MAG: maleylpyruvate isomerase N-terminal domain-containing protein [Pseudonocardiaceae bacterium]
MFDVVYRDAHGRLAELARALSVEQLRTPVSATPAWTVHEVFAHLVGGAADVASGRLDGLPGDEWTARHVGERRQHTISELLAEWDLVGPRAQASCAGEVRGPNLGLDIICHEGDLHETLVLGRPERDHWQPALDVMVGFLGRRLKQPGTLVICGGHGQQWHIGDGEPQTMLTIDGYELLRGMFSRRSQRQIAGWAWMPAPAERLQRFGAFGPREDDQPIPAM